MARALHGPRNAGRALNKGETEGFMKVLVAASSYQILGATLLGIEGEVIHTFLDLVYAKAPNTVVTRAMHIHHTVSECLPSLLHALKPLGG